MLIALALLAFCAGARVIAAALQSLRGLPRSNEDWIYY